MRNASDAQVRFLYAWKKSYGDDLATVMKENGVSGSAFEDLDMTMASQIISTMVAMHGEPKKGKDSDDHNLDGLGHGHGQDEYDHEDKLNLQGNGQGNGQGQGEGDGEGNGDGQGQGQYENNFRDGSKESKVAESLIKNGMNEDQTFDDLKDQVGQKPLDFKSKNEYTDEMESLPEGSNYDKTSDKTQKGRLRKLIKDTKRKMESEQGQKDGQQQQGGGGQQQGQGNGKGGQGQETEAEFYIRKVREGRALMARMDADGKAFDSWGLRQAIFGAKMLKQGFPAKMILDAISMHWPKELRREWMDGKNLPAFDITKLWKSEQDPERHPALPALKRIALSGTPIFMVGGKGNGKTTLAEQLNDVLNEHWGTDHEFGFASMTSGTSPGEFKGRITLDGFLPALFEKIFTEGGVYLFDELDAGDENLLTLLNSALANGYFVNNKGQRLIKHPQFVPVAAGNTLGLGANTQYTGRNRLDAATLDRFSIGRVRIEFSEKLEDKLYWDIINQEA